MVLLIVHEWEPREAWLRSMTVLVGQVIQRLAA